MHMCICICSVQSENLQNLEIALCILRIPRLRNYSTQSFITLMRVCGNHLMVTREATKIATLCSVGSDICYIL